MFEKGRRSNLVAGGRLFSVYCSRLAIGKKLTVFSVYCSRLAIGKKLTGMLPGASLSCKRHVVDSRHVGNSDAARGCNDGQFKNPGVSGTVTIPKN
jgi:hypothetical protein